MLDVALAIMTGAQPRLKNCYLKQYTREFGAKNR